MNLTVCAYDAPNHIGGPNTALRRLLPALPACGYDPRVLFFGEGDLAAGATAQALGQSGIAYVQTRRPFYTEAYVRWLLAQLAAAPPDVFLPDYVAQAYFVGRWLRAAGIPSVGVIHGEDRYYDGLVEQFVLGDPAGRLSGLVCVSQAAEQSLRSKYPALPPETLVRYIPHGVPIPDRSAPPPGERLRLAYVGRLVETNKRVTEMTRLFIRAARVLPGVEAMLYGDGPSRPALEKLLRDEGQGLPIALAGNVDNSQIQARLLEQHVLVLLSDTEGLPISLLEAMACGVVPICLRRPSGVLELVEDGVTGLLVDDRGDDFIAALRRLREQPGLWERLSQAARAKIAARYTIGQSAARWAGFFDELRARSGPRQPMAFPERLALPPVNPLLAHVDERERALPGRALRWLRFRVGKLKRRLSAYRS